MQRNRGNTRETRDTKGSFNENMGTIKNRNGIDLTGTEDEMAGWYHRLDGHEFE